MCGVLQRHFTLKGRREILLATSRHVIIDYNFIDKSPGRVFDLCEGKYVIRSAWLTDSAAVDEDTLHAVKDGNCSTSL